MAWNATVVWATGMLVTASHGNKYWSENADYLLGGRAIGVKNLRDVGNVTSTSTTFANVSGLSVDVTLVSTRALLFLSGFFGAAPNTNLQTYGFLDVAINGDRQSGHANGYLQYYGGSVGGIYYSNSGEPQPALIVPFTGLTPGATTFQIMWRAHSAYSTTVRLEGTKGGRLMVVEY